MSTPAEAVRQLLTPDDVAERLNVSRKTVARVTENGELRAVRIARMVVRYDSGDVEEYIERKKAQGFEEAAAWARSSRTAQGLTADLNVAEEVRVAAAIGGET